jgi:iron complex outermembrane receptor protein
MSKLLHLSKPLGAPHGGLRRCLPGLTALAAAIAASPESVFSQVTEGVLEEIIVTSRFREENLQDTPLAITVFTGENMEARSLTDVTDLDAFVPNAVIAPLGAGWGATAATYIRGVGLGDNSLSYEPGVPIYIDDVYHGRPQGAILDLLDLERVEVLRGPQGTLFGKNAVGGTVRLVSRKPQGDNTGSISVNVGNRNRLDARAVFDFPLIEDKLLARVAASSKKQDGYHNILDYECATGIQISGGGVGIPAGFLSENGLPDPENMDATGIPPISIEPQLTPNDIGTEQGCVTDTLGDENVQSIRGALRLIASDTVEINYIGDYMIQDQKGPSDKYVIKDNDNYAFANTFYIVPVFGVGHTDQFLTDDPYTSYHLFNDPVGNKRVLNQNDMTHYGHSITVDWDISDNVSFKSVTAYREFENTYGRDSDGTPIPWVFTWDTAKHEQFSQEFQITGGRNRFTWATGAFVYDATDTNQGWVRGPAYLAITTNHYDEQDTDNWAVFAHGTFAITDRIGLNMGVRYTDDEKYATIFRQNATTLEVLIPNTPVVVEGDEVSPKFGIDWQVTEDALLYFQYSTGFRGGGFGPRPANSLQVASFDFEYLDNYEIGLKSDWFGGRLRLNAALFTMDYTDQQQPAQRCAPCVGETDPNTGLPSATNVAWFRAINTGASSMDGFEVEIQAEPIDNLQLQASIGHLDYFRDDPGETNFCQYDQFGRKCQALRAPDWTYGIGVSYSFPLGGGTLTPRLDWTYQDDIHFSVDDPINGLQKAYDVVNARVTWESSNSEWEIGLFGTNLTDEVYYNGKLSLVLCCGGEQGNVAEPKQYGITIRRDF